MKPLIPLFALLMLLPAFTNGQTRISGQSAPVSLNIRKKKLPPILTIKDLIFTDANGNNRIDGMEKCRISFAIENSGSGPAVGMRMAVADLNSVKGLNFQEGTSLPAVDPGMSMKVEIPLTGTIELSTGQARFSVSFDEPLGFPPDPFEMKIETKAFQAPDVRVADYLFTTPDGIIRLGYPVQLKALIQNRGQGTAEEVTMVFRYPAQNVFPNSEETFRLGTLNPGETREVLFDFSASKLYTEPAIPIQIKLSEKYGRYSQNGNAIARVDATTGKQTFEIASTAVDREVPIQDASLTADVDKNVPENPVKNQFKVALIIGNEDYSGTLNAETDVEFARRDAEIFREYTLKTLGIEERLVFTLTNATAGVMKSEIDRTVELVKRMGSEAELIFYYAGHGLPDEKTREPFLIPVDVNASNLSSGIPLNEMYRKFSGTGAKKITVILDACFSGGGRNTGLLAARAVRIQPKEEPVSGNMVVFAATSGEQSALPYRQQKHGMFTYFLLKKLQETKGKTTFGELDAWLRSKVGTESLIVNRKNQDPVTTVSPDLADKWAGLTF